MQTTVSQLADRWTPVRVQFFEQQIVETAGLIRRRPAHLSLPQFPLPTLTTERLLVSETRFSGQPTVETLGTENRVE